MSSELVALRQEPTGLTRAEPVLRPMTRTAFAVPKWYHVVMAMNLRLDEEDSELLRALADAEHVSLHEAVLRAIRRSAREIAHTDRVREATAEMMDRWGDVLDRLGRA